MFRRRRYLILVSLILVVLLASWRWSQLINAMLPAGNRPAAMDFPVQEQDQEAFAATADNLRQTFAEADFEHIQRFEEAGITAYRGPRTCLRCHEKMTVAGPDGQPQTVDLMENLTSSAHYRFFTMEHPNVWGFNGKKADNFPMGKLNRPCPKPGSFAMTAWAEFVITQAGDTLSEGCGQCHIGGQPSAPLGEMMPLYRTTAQEEAAIDCLICHAVAYDMNRKVVIQDDDGRTHWGQDRSLRAALSVGTPTAPACLRCHQHNMGGDIFVDEDNPQYHQSLVRTGRRAPRVLHPGSKRGTPYSPGWDVHADAGMDCIECHATRGHLMAKGTHTTTMMANDLPTVEVSCLECHDDGPHDADTPAGQALNDHLERLVCQVCHIPSLHPDNMTRRDFAHTEWEEDPGIHIYHDDPKLNQPGEGIAYVWWNGDCTFLGNPIGDNPNGAGLYRFYDAPHRWPEGGSTSIYRISDPSAACSCPTTYRRTTGMAIPCRPRVWKWANP